MEKGVVYVITVQEENSKFIEELNRSAKSVKTHTELDITLFCNKNISSPYIDTVKNIEDPDYDSTDKILPLKQTPYEKTLFIDSDTYITQDITDMFDLLDRYDLAVAHGPNREMGKTKNVPDAFAEFNTGVILYRQDDVVNQFISNWYRTYERDYAGKNVELMDQPAFREALYHSDVDFYVLPPEYNCRFIYPGYVYGDVKILHGRHPDMEKMAEVLNADAEFRVHTGNHHRHVYSYPPPVIKRKYPGPGRLRYTLQTIRRHIDENGFRETMQLVGQRARERLL